MTMPIFENMIEGKRRPGIYRRNLIRFIQAYNICRFAEIGVAYGNTAGTIMKACKDQILEYYAVDPWKPYYSAGIDRRFKQMNEESWNKMYEGVCRKLNKYNAVKILRLTSEQAARSFEPESLDMVFLDGDHSFVAVTMDIELWLPKIKKGGFLSGHDYNSQPPHFPCPEVYEAVRAAFPLGIKEIPKQIWLVRVE